METLEELIANKNDYYINYIENITKHHCRKDAIDIFHEYFQSKEELFQCLGRKLSVSKHVSVDLQETAIMYQLEKLYEPMQDYNTAIKNKSEFIDTVHKFIFTHFSSRYGDRIGNSPLGEAEDIAIALREVSGYEEIYKQNVPKDIVLHLHGKRALKIGRNARPMRAFRKILEYIDYPDIESFNEWRDQISLVLTNKKISGTLVVSIDPIDFLSLSNNNSNWRSCMKMPDGEYCHTISTMMNSPYSLVAYLKNDKDKFIVNGQEYPNKTWRMLMFFDVDKHEWICNTVEYPFHSSSLRDESFNLLKETLGQTFGISFREPVQNEAFTNMDEIAQIYSEENGSDSGYYDDYEDEYYVDESWLWEQVEDGDEEMMDFITDNSPMDSVCLYTNPYYNDLYASVGQKRRALMICWRDNLNGYLSRGVNVAGQESCLNCGSIHNITSEDRRHRGNVFFSRDESVNTHLCIQCAKYNEGYNFIMAPQLSYCGFVSNYRNLYQTVQKYLRDRYLNSSPTAIKKIIADNIFTFQDTDINRIVHGHIPIGRYTDELFTKNLCYIKCKDISHPELNFFIDKDARKRKCNVAFKTGEEGLYDVHPITPIDILYLVAKYLEEHNNLDNYYCFGIQVEDIEGLFTYVDLVFPEKYKDYIGMMEVTDDRDKMYEVLSSI